jgi:hypothetical protein
MSKPKTMRSFGGYGEESEFFHVPWTEFFNRTKGDILVGIGEGKFSNAMYQALAFAYARGAREHQIRMEKETK